MGFIGELEEVIYYVSFFLGKNLVIRFVRKGVIVSVLICRKYVNWVIYEECKFVVNFG